LNLVISLSGTDDFAFMAVTLQTSYLALAIIAVRIPYEPFLILPESF
jgi:hypothetical protein